MTEHYPPLHEQECGNCRYLRFLLRIWQCRRHAPTISSSQDTIAQWPTISDPGKWCGEWAPDEEEED